MHSFVFFLSGVIVDGTRLELSSQSGELEPGLNELDFSVSVVSSNNGAEVTGNDLWRLEIFTAKDKDGTKDKTVLQAQSLTPDLASRDLRAGSRLIFTNLAAQVDRDLVNCQGNTYICANIYRGDRPSVDFKLEGSSSGALMNCREVSCAKKR